MSPLMLQEGDAPCGNCGRQIPAGDKFCRNCGRPTKGSVIVARSATALPENVAAASAAAPRPRVQPTTLCASAYFCFIFSLIPFIPALSQITSIVLGIKGLKRISQSNGILRGKGFAVAGLVISTVTMLLLVVTVVPVLIVSFLKSK